MRCQWKPISLNANAQAFSCAIFAGTLPIALLMRRWCQMTEKDIQSAIMKAVSTCGAVVFRNNVGRAPLGDFNRLPNGDYIVRHGRVTDFGVCNPGGSDLIGWRTITLTEDMINQKIAVFLALEVKTKTGSIRPEQKIFINNVRTAGGLSGVVRSVDEAVGICNPLGGI
jgi:hypothetical protein